jgi:ABC-type antimicrobial peptide transport system permease subunit
MNVRIRKIFNDLLLRKGRTLTTIAGLVIGLWGVGTVAVAWGVLSNDLAENFVMTDPPDLIMRLSHGPAPELAEIRALDSVEGAENRPMIGARLQVSGDRWLPIMLFVVSDFQNMQVARAYPNEGPFPPPEGEILIEKAGRVLIRLMGQGRDTAPSSGHGGGQGAPSSPARTSEHSANAPGAPVIQLPGGVTVETRIAGNVFDPGQAPSNMERLLYGYISQETARQWMPEGVRSRLLIRTRLDDQGRAAPRQVAEKVTAILATQGLTVDNVNLPARDEHPHQFQMNSILFLLAGLGALALLTSTVLVLNLVNGLLTNQIRQIGSLKAIGATRYQVAVLYLASMLIVGLLAATVALPLAQRAGYGMSRVLAAMLNFEILTRELPWTYYAMLMVGGCLFPVLAAFRPVQRWSGVAVRDALENFGVSKRARGGSAIDQVRLPLPLPARTGLRNALRNPRRFLLAVLSLAVGAGVFLVTMNLRASLLHTADLEEQNFRFDVAVTFENDVAWNQVSWMAQFPESRSMELWPVTGLRVRDREMGSDRYTVVGVPSNARALGPNLIAGTWVSDAAPDGVVATHRLMQQNPDLAVGDTLDVEIDGQSAQLTIVGVNKQFGPSVFYMPASGLREITGTSSDIGRMALLTLDDSAYSAQADMVAKLEQHFDLAGLQVSQVTTAKMASKIIRNHLDVIIATLAIIALLILTVCGLGVASGIGTSVIERTREIGVLRAIGATPSVIGRILMVEALFVTLVAWILAVAVATPLSRSLGEYFGNAIVEYPFDAATSVDGMFICLLVMSALSVLATLGPARMATRQSVREAVSYE